MKLIKITYKDVQKILKQKLIEISYCANLAHIPSALSMLGYLSVMIPIMLKSKRKFKWVAGKQFGTQAYYTIYETMNRKDLIPYDQISNPVLLNKVNTEFTYIEETLGNSFGVAIGMSLADKTPIWLNVSDSVFQMGRVLEALPLMDKFNSKVLITIDGNNCTRSTQGSIPESKIRAMVVASDIRFISIDVEKEWLSIHNLIESIVESLDGPLVIYFKTTKGDGVKRFENDPVTWHYKRMTDIEYKEILEEVKGDD